MSPAWGGGNEGPPKLLPGSIGRRPLATAPDGLGSTRPRPLRARGGHITKDLLDPASIRISSTSHQLISVQSQRPCTVPPINLSCFHLCEDDVCLAGHGCPIPTSTGCRHRQPVTLSRLPAGAFRGHGARGHTMHRQYGPLTQARASCMARLEPFSSADRLPAPRPCTDRAGRIVGLVSTCRLTGIFGVR